MRNIVVATLIALVAVFTYPSFPAQAETGVVLMHGKGGKNKSKAPTKVLAKFLEGKGYLVSSPDMPWQANRIFDKTVDEAMIEIDEIVADLRSRGADKIVVAGHSLGANAAIAYGSRRDGLAGIIAIAPGHVPEVWRDRFANDVAKAKEMVEAGNGDRSANFSDVNQGKTTTYNMSAKNYLSWYDPDGEAVMPKNAANIKQGTPLMWIVGEKDSMAERGKDYAFTKAPANPKSLYEVIGGGHGATPKKGKDNILSWLENL